MLAQRFVDTLFNLVLLVGIPLAVYYAYHRLRHKRGAGAVLRRAGLQVGDTSYLRHAAIAVVVLLFVMPEHWPLLILIFAGSLFGGWLRIRSESILSPWLIHGGANLAVTMSVLARSSGG
jgi:hypothetical protein